MAELISWTNANQGFLNFILILVTTIYVIFTYRLVHAPYKSSLTPSSELGFEPDFYLTNNGPGVAINVKIKAITGVLMASKTSKLGPIVIKQGETGKFGFVGLLSEWPIIITWKTAIGKTQKMVCRVDRKSTSHIVVIGNWEYFLLLVKMIFDRYQSPFVKVFRIFRKNDFG